MRREGIWGWIKPRESKEVEKTAKISSKGDGVNMEEHPFADEKAELHPYKHTDSPVRDSEGYKTVEDIESHHSGTGNPEDMMIAEEEEKAKDPYAIYNEQGDTRPPQREVTFEDYEEDEKYFEKIADMSAKADDNKDNFSLTSNKEEKFKTPVEIKKEIKVKMDEEKFWDRSEKRPNRDRGQKPERKNRPTGIRKILGK